MNSSLRIILLALLSCITEAGRAEETTPAGIAMELASYSGSGAVINCDVGTYRKILEAVCDLPEEKKIAAECNVFSIIYGATIPVVDRVKKINYGIDFIVSGKLPLNGDVLSNIVPFMDSVEDEEVFVKTIRLLVEKCNVSVVPDSNNNAVRVMASISE